MIKAAHIFGLPFAASNLLGMLVRNLRSTISYFDANYAVVGTAHAHIGLVSRSTGQHALIGRWNVSMRAQHRGDAAIQVPAHRNFLAGCLRMKVHHNHLGGDSGQQVVDEVERIVGSGHEHAAHQVDHRIIHATLGCTFKDAVAGKAGL